MTAETPGQWQAGTATVTITPEENTWMAGYSSRDSPSNGVVQDLYATALALQDGAGTRFVVVGADLLGISREIRREVEAAVQAEHDLPPEGLLLAASHTHCGPEFRRSEFHSRKLDAEHRDRVDTYVDGLIADLRAVVADALADLAPATLSYTHARAGFGMNRRTNRNGRVENHPNPDGPVDTDVPVLRVDSPDGDLRAVLFSYACHNTTQKIYQFCGDWAGYAKEYLLEEYPDITPVFLTGCAGNQNPYPRREPGYVNHHGRTMANAVETALQADAKPVEGPLSSTLSSATIEYEHCPTREELRERLDSDDSRDREKAQYLLEQLDRTGSLPETYAYPIQVARFGAGGPTLVAMGGEPVVEYGLQFTELFDGPVIPCGHSNAYSGYITTPEILAAGGYEGRRWVRTKPHPSPYAASTEARIVEKVVELVETVSTAQ